MSLMDILVDYARPPILCAGAVAVAVTVALLRRTSCLAALTVLPVFFALARRHYNSTIDAMAIPQRIYSPVAEAAAPATAVNFADDRD